jgi:hypothetical protein
MGGLAALVPKCLVCVAGYLALGAGLAAQTPEWCGAVADESPGSQRWFVVTAAAFLIGAVGVVAAQRVRGSRNGENTKKQSS